MTDTTFTEFVTPLEANWLNDINKAAYYGAQVLTNVTGTGDAMVATLPLVPNNPVGGQTLWVIPPGANTSTTPTLTISNGPAAWSSARTITYKGGVLPAGLYNAGNPLLLQWSPSTSTWVYLSGSAGSGVITDTSTARTLALTDAWGYIRMNNAAANTVTVPPNSSVAFPIGTEITVFQLGAGATSFVAGAGVTINAVSLALTARYRAATLKKAGTDEWDLIGAV